MTRKDYITIAAILAKHHASEEMVSAFSAELAEDNPKFDAQRFKDAALPLKHTVFVASAFWQYSDPFVTVVGNDPKRVEKTIKRAIKDAAIDANNADPKSVRRHMDDINWTGVNEFAFDAIIPQHVIAQYEAEVNGIVAHSPDMDFSDYQQLRDGERDAIVYLN